MMKCILSLLLSMSIYIVEAQIAQTSVMEHFTNTTCSVCASRNGGIYGNIAANPHVIHLTFHPSSPYTDDIFNVTNKDENDDRTRFYNIYGATPQAIVNGGWIPTSSLSTTLPSLANSMSNYKVVVEQTRASIDSFRVTTYVKKIAPDAMTKALFFAGAIEDTVTQATRNGESLHLNVFRKALSKIGGDTITLPSIVGDSIIMNYGYKVPTNWQLDKMESLVILQDTFLNPTNEIRLVINADRTFNTSELIVLPVILSDFNVKQINNSALLSWTTEVEVNADYYNVLHSKDGINFSGISKAKAKGNSISTTSYKYEHQDLEPGHHYYKLQQVDVDGASAFSETKTIDFANNNAEKVIVFPNPSTGIIGFNKEVSTAVITDLSGRIIQNYDGGKISNLDLSALAKGLYILSIDSGQEKYKIVLEY